MPSLPTVAVGDPGHVSDHNALHDFYDDVLGTTPPDGYLLSMSGGVLTWVDLPIVYASQYALKGDRSAGDAAKFRLVLSDFRTAGGGTLVWDVAGRTPRIDTLATVNNKVSGARFPSNTSVLVAGGAEVIWEAADHLCPPAQSATGAYPRQMRLWTNWNAFGDVDGVTVHDSNIFIHRMGLDGRAAQQTVCSDGTTPCTLMHGASFIGVDGLTIRDSTFKNTRGIDASTNESMACNATDSANIFFDALHVHTDDGGTTGSGCTITRCTRAHVTNLRAHNMGQKGAGCHHTYGYYATGWSYSNGWVGWGFEYSVVRGNIHAGGQSVDNPSNFNPHASQVSFPNAAAGVLLDHCYAGTKLTIDSSYNATFGLQFSLPQGLQEIDGHCRSNTGLGVSVNGPMNGNIDLERLHIYANNAGGNQCQFANETMNGQTASIGFTRGDGKMITKSAAFWTVTAGGADNPIPMPWRTLLLVRRTNGAHTLTRIGAKGPDNTTAWFKYDTTIAGPAIPDTMPTNPTIEIPRGGTLVLDGVDNTNLSVDLVRLGS